MKLQNLVEAAPKKPAAKKVPEPAQPPTPEPVPTEEVIEPRKKTVWNAASKDVGVKPSEVVSQEVLQIILKHTQVVSGQPLKINHQAAIDEIKNIKGINPLVLSKSYSNLRLFHDSLRIFLSEFRKQLGI